MTKKSLYAQPLIHDEAIITSLVRYGEADCIARLFCRDKGRVSAFVKNGFKPSLRRGSVLQAPARAKVGYRVRANGDLLNLQHVDLAAYSFLFASSLRSWGLASYAVEITELFVPEHEPAPQIFDLLEEVLYRLAHQEINISGLRAFELKLLAFCGYLPDLSDAVDCPGQKVSAYDPLCGHLLASMRPELLSFSEEARQAALYLLHAPFESMRAYEEPVLRQVSQIFVNCLKEHSKGPLRSVEFLKSSGV